MLAAQIAMLALLASRPVVAASCGAHVNVEAGGMHHAEHARVHAGHGGDHGLGHETSGGDPEVPAALAMALACCNAHATAILPLLALRSISIFAGIPVSEQPQRLSSASVSAVDPPPRALL